jgi:hypothetical protein
MAKPDLDIVDPIRIRTFLFKAGPGHLDPDPVPDLVPDMVPDPAPDMVLHPVPDLFPSKLGTGFYYF